MPRLFNEHKIRQTQDLGGIWEIQFPSDGTTIGPTDWNAEHAISCLVPGIWESLPGRINFRGQALIRREFEVPNSGPVRLVFRGVSHTARVFLDGEEVACHHNAFTPFAVDLPNLPAGPHELMLHVSNEHGDISALHIPNDYYNYGGITRPVEAQFLNAPVWIHFAHFTPQFESGRWKGKLTAKFGNHGVAWSGQIRVQLADIDQIDHLDIPAGGGTWESHLTFDNIQPWAPETPNLYQLRVTLIGDGAAVDDLIDRTGFRTVTADGERILLNGKPVFLRGFNRHEDHGTFGCALPLEIQFQDVQILKDLNCNAVRTSHYPNDERFLDLCDEFGLMVWEENHARGLTLAQMQHPLFREQCAACINEMIQWHYNHPSIILWGILNECSSETPEGRELYREQFEQVQALDRSRPTTFASCRHYTDICQDLPDVCGWNWYFNWYSDLEVAPELTKMLTFIDTHGGGGKPVIASEFGGGAIPGYYDPVRRAKWSEERQCDVLAENLEVQLGHPRLSGTFIWQFCDVRVDNAYAMVRPRCMNDKGVVDEFRRPKLAFELVKQHFRDQAALESATPAD